MLWPRTGVFIPFPTIFLLLLTCVHMTMVYDACANAKLHLVHDVTVTQMNLKVHVLLVRGNSEKLWIFSTKHLSS